MKIRDQEILLSLFADDLAMMLDYNQESWQQILNTLDDFYRWTGLKVNYEKTSVYRMGSLKGSNAKFYSAKKLNWTNEPLQILGVTLDVKEKQLHTNMESVIEKIKNVSQVWKMRNLSIISKIQIVNALMMPVFVHKLYIMPLLSDNLITKVKNIIIDFIWDGKSPKIPYAILTGTKKDGGLGLIDVCKKDKVLKMQWVEKVKKDQQLEALAYESLNTCIGHLVWCMRLSKKHVKICFPYDNFWTDVAYCWNDENCKNNATNLNVENLNEQMLWYNSGIQIKG